MKRFLKWDRMGKLKRPCDNPTSAVLNTLKFYNILRCNVIKKRVTVILVVMSAEPMVLATETEI